ncbi:MAG: EcsC family protein [Butyricicoccus sp.]
MKEPYIRRSAIQKELQLVRKQEQALERAAMRERRTGWKQSLEDKIPEKVVQNLEKAFCKAFSVVFEKGTGVIERTYDREQLEQEHTIQDFAFEVRENRKSLKALRRSASSSDLRNMAMTAAEGIGLGALGIGLPDIVVFVGVLLKGIYETALHYGFSYDTPEEQQFILKLMQTAMLRQSEWQEANREIDRLIASGELPVPEPDKREEQMQRTAEAFAMDMLLLKFVQGLPIAGVLGGAGNPVYYRRVMKYVQIKYRKRYLLGKQNG